MIILLSGEGPTDLGKCDLSLKECSNNEDGNFVLGVLTYLIDDILSSKIGYSLKDIPGSIYFKNKSYLKEKGKENTGGKKLLNMRGIKKEPETNYYYNNARALGQLALELKQSEKSPVIAILFRDSDGTRSTNNNDWQVKYDSILDGFNSVKFHTGVPMLAKPKSEAWLLAACKENPYQYCGKLEDESGNDNSPNPLKEQLSNRIGCEVSSQNLIQWFLGCNYQYEIVAEQMPSFNAFYEKFCEAIQTCLKE